MSTVFRGTPWTTNCPTLPLQGKKKILLGLFRNTGQEVEVERHPNSSPDVESPDEIPNAEDNFDHVLPDPHRHQRQMRDRHLKAECHQRHPVPHRLNVESALATVRDGRGLRTPRVHTRESQAVHLSQSGYKRVSRIDHPPLQTKTTKDSGTTTLNTQSRMYP